MSGSENGLGSVGDRLGALLPGLAAGGDRPVLTPEEWEAADREALVAAQAEARAAQVEHRVSVLLAGRPPYFTGAHPVPDGAVRWAGAVGSGQWAGCLWLGGVRGSGKTSAAWAVAELAVRSGYCGRVLRVRAGDLWETLAPPVDTEARRAYATVDLLILDDLGKGGLSAWDRKHLHWIVDERTTWHRPTIMTSEGQLKDVVDPATWSRLAERITPEWLGTFDHRLGVEVTPDAEGGL